MASTSSDNDLSETTRRISESKEVEVVTPSRKRRHVEVESPRVYLDDDDGNTCSVCLDVWTSAGAHRLCALKCGHLFGKSCVTRWLSGQQKTCPQCNTAARKKDIREIYATKLVAVDNNEAENLRFRCTQLQTENSNLQSRVNMLDKMVEFYKAECEKLSAQNEAAKDLKRAITESELFKPRVGCSVRLDGTSRVMAYCKDSNVIAISQEHVGPLWPGFGVKLFSNQGEQISAHQPIHKKEVRDMAFHPRNPDLLLTVSLDQYVKVTDITNKKTVFSWLSPHRLWSCCWDSELEDVAYVGTERGHVIRLSTENAQPVLPGISTEQPVAVIALSSSRKLRSLIFCGLLSVWCVWYFTSGDDRTEHRMQRLLTGSYGSMLLNESSLDDEVTMILSSRPGATSTPVRHFLYRLRQTGDSDGYSVEVTQQHSIRGGTGSQLFRPAFLSTLQGSYLFFFNDSDSTVVGWDVQNDKKVFSIKVHAVARHLVTVLSENQLTLHMLMPSLLKSYTMNIQ